MKKLLLAVCMMLICSGIVSIHAQGHNGSINGTVKLADGSRVPGVVLTLTGNYIGKMTQISSINGNFRFLNLPPGSYELKAELEGFKTKIHKGLGVEAGKKLKVNILLETTSIKEEILVYGKAPVTDVRMSTPSAYPGIMYIDGINMSTFNTEEYSRIYENQFKDPAGQPLSTFSIDVDTASYANSRRFIKQNSFPPKDAVRIEEFINYFSYDYPQPDDNHPFSIISETSTCPWNQEHLIVHIGLQGKKIKTGKHIPSNLVFLIDVSGSMNNPFKLPLLQSAFKLLVNQLKGNDRVAIVVYAGAAGMVLPSTPGDQKDRINEAINRLRAGGSTAGGAGIKLAYRVAVDNLISQGNNRVILATDGDFNVGVSSTSQLVRMIEKKREKGVFLTVMGFGMGNYKDSRMEQIADKGNGNYFYIDSLLEAKKVFINELGGTLFTIAKDVKIQVEFNPAKVKAYKLIGYENRLLENEDFNDDTKDAGELGAGHTVTALYEIIPANSREKIPGVDMLKYQRKKISARAYKCKELMTVKLRYKKPKGKKSKLIEVTVADNVLKLDKTSDNFRFSSAVAEFGLLLRDSQLKARASYENVLTLAKGAKGTDKHGYRAEFIQLVEMSQLMNNSRLTLQHQ